MFPGTHWVGLGDADVVLVIESDLPWIEGNDRPNPDAQVFVIDSGDPLKLNIGYAHVDADMICRADGEVAIRQIEAILWEKGVRPVDEKWALPADVDGNRGVESRVHARRGRLAQAHAALVTKLDEAERFPPFFLPSEHISESTAKAFAFTVPGLMRTLRRTINAAIPSGGETTLILNEAISNFPAVWHHMRPEFPGAMITSGGSSLGWALGAAVGASLSRRAVGDGTSQPDLIVAIVGDGSFMFGVPSSVYWMARRYETVRVQ